MLAPEKARDLQARLMTETSQLAFTCSKPAAANSHVSAGKNGTVAASCPGMTKLMFMVVAAAFSVAACHGYARVHTTSVEVDIHHHHHHHHR